MEVSWSARESIDVVKASHETVDGKAAGERERARSRESTTKREIRLRSVYKLVAQNWFVLSVIVADKVASCWASLLPFAISFTVKGPRVDQWID